MILESINNNRAPLAPALYIITNIGTGGFYIGSSRNGTRRINQHLRMLESGTHFNYNVQRDFNNHQALSVCILRVTTREEAFRLEADLLLKYSHEPLLQNILKKPANRDESVNIALSASLRKQGPTPSQLAGLLKAQAVSPRAKHWIGRTHDPYTIEKMKQSKYTHSGTQRQINELIDRVGVKVMCNGVVYRSASEAARALSVSQPSIIRWCNSSRHPNFTFVQQ